MVIRRARNFDQKIPVFSKKHFLTCWTEEQQQQQVAPIKTLLLRHSVWKIHNEQSSALPQWRRLRCPWGAARWPTKQDCVVQTNHRVIPVLWRPLTIQLYWEEGGIGSAMRQHCAFIIALISPLSPWATVSTLLLYRLEAPRNSSL